MADYFPPEIAPVTPQRQLDDLLRLIALSITIHYLGVPKPLGTALVEEMTGLAIEVLKYSVEHPFPALHGGKGFLDKVREQVLALENHPPSW